MTVETGRPEEIVDHDPRVLRDRAARRVRKRRVFRAHVVVFAAVNLLLWCVWLAVGLHSQRWYPWPVWATLGWGIAIVLHAWGVYFRRPVTEDDIRREMDRLANDG